MDENYNFNYENENRNIEERPVFTAQPVSAPVAPPLVTPPSMVYKKKQPFMQRLLIAIALGLAFGICAALGFYAVNQISGEKAPSIIQSADTKELQAQIDALSKQINNGGTKTENVILPSENSDKITAVVSDVSDVVEKVMPSMVSIVNLYENTTYYFGRQYVSEEQASGSGIIIGENDTEYILVTNYHVIEDTIQLTVTFADGAEAAAYVKGYDASMDIAVISVSKDSLQKSTMMSISVAEIGNSDILKMGEPAIAIGNALGYGQSVTTGVISALNRHIDIENSYDSLIQTSAAINPGNSGGALLNVRGQVVGINSSKIGGSTIEGMGYAIPINAVREIIEDFSARDVTYKIEEDERGYLGISGATVDEATVATFGIPEGVYVTRVYERSAAEEAGIINGDVITKVNSQSVKTINELQETLSYYRGGETIKITLMRAGTTGYEETEIEVTLSSKSVFD